MDIPNMVPSFSFHLPPDAYAPPPRVCDESEASRRTPAPPDLLQRFPCPDLPFHRPPPAPHLPAPPPSAKMHFARPNAQMTIPRQGYLKQDRTLAYPMQVRSTYRPAHHLFNRPPPPHPLRGPSNLLTSSSHSIHVNGNGRFSSAPSEASAKCAHQLSPARPKSYDLDSFGHPEKSLEYNRLNNDANSGRIVFRVHSSASASKLEWTGECSSSGFTATNRSFSNLSPHVYQLAFDHLMSQVRKWISGPYVAETVVRHVLQLPFGGMGMSTTDHISDSPWVSATASLDWAVWAIARALSRSEVALVRLAVIRKCTYPRSRQSYQSGHPTHPIPASEINFPAQQSVTAIGTGCTPAVVANAGRCATECSEVLYYGRIFSDSIEVDMVWTARQLPFALPAKFWRKPLQHDKGWLKRLKWNPAEDSYGIALAKIRTLPSVPWPAQPVHSFSCRWPPVEPKTTPKAAESVRTVPVSNLVDVA